MPGPPTKFRLVEVTSGRNRFTHLEEVSYTPRELVEEGTGYVYNLESVEGLAEAVIRSIDYLCRNVLWITPTPAEVTDAQIQVKQALIKRGQNTFTWIGSTVVIPEWGTRCDFIFSEQAGVLDGLPGCSVLILQNIDKLSTSYLKYALDLLTPDYLKRDPEVIYTTDPPEAL